MKNYMENRHYGNQANIFYVNKQLSQAKDELEGIFASPDSYSQDELLRILVRVYDACDIAWHSFILLRNFDNNISDKLKEYQQEQIKLSEESEKIRHKVSSTLEKYREEDDKAESLSN